MYDDTPSNISGSDDTEAWAVITTKDEGEVIEGGGVEEGDITNGNVMHVKVGGKWEKVNLTVVKKLNEHCRRWKGRDEGKEGQGMNALREIEPFKDVAMREVEKIRNGLSGVGMLTGKYTKVGDADVGSVASMLRMKETLEKDVVEGLWELKERTRNRKKLLEDMKEEQVKQVGKLREHISQLKDRVIENGRRYEGYVKQGKEIEGRSRAAMEACGELARGITNAEKGYFEQLKIWEGLGNRWEVEIGEMGRKGRRLEMGGERKIEELGEREEGMIRDLLKGQGVLGKKIEDVLKRNKYKGVE